MKLICSSRGIVNAQYPCQGIMDIKEAGFQRVMYDLSVLCDEGEDFESGWKRIRDKSGNSGLEIGILAVPRWGDYAGHKDSNGSRVELSLQSIAFCGEVGCSALIVPPIFTGIPKARLWDENRNFYESLAERAAKENVNILLRAECRNLNGHMVRGVCSDGSEAADWVDRLNEDAGEERFGFCMDVGTCNLCGQNMYEFAKVLGHRIKAVIIRDNDGHCDNAMLPFTATNKGAPQTDWLSLIRGLREIGFDGLLVLDMSSTALAASPLLKPGLLRYARSVMEYFRWQIEMEGMLKGHSSRVLFGAGNMCRNYMKCYGEQYPPLFTCDNNPARWGSTFCGLPVKSPDALLELSDDVAVLVCNVYYREIEAQLRGMGIGNPIEFFSDEYMPSFYFDRV